MLDSTRRWAYRGIYEAQTYRVDSARRAMEASALGKAVIAKYELGPMPLDWDKKEVSNVWLKQVIPAMVSWVHRQHGWE